METFIRWIQHLSDIDYQIRVWLKGEGPECQDFDEFVDFFLDEGGLILKNYKDFGITEIQNQQLLKLYNSVKLIADKYYHPCEFMAKPEWTKITEMAKEVLAAFNYQKK